MKEDNDNEKILLKKADTYNLLGELVHITYKRGNWKRGTITDVKTDFFMLNERMEGLQPVFFAEIESIEKFRLKKEGSGYGKE